MSKNHCGGEACGIGDPYAMTACRCACGRCLAFDTVRGDVASALGTSAIRADVENLIAKLIGLGVALRESEKRAEAAERDAERLRQGHVAVATAPDLERVARELEEDNHHANCAIVRAARLRIATLKAALLLLPRCPGTFLRFSADNRVHDMKCTKRSTRWVDVLPEWSYCDEHAGHDHGISDTPWAEAVRALEVESAPNPAATKQRQVFLVTSGEYSSYGVDTVWSTRELAEAEVARNAGPTARPGGEEDIEAFWLDLPNATETPRWSVYLAHEGRTVVDRYKNGHAIETNLNEHGVGHVIVEADTEERAIKIASEKRAEWLAQQGVTRS